MNAWANLKVRTKQMLLIGICCLAMLTVGAMGILGMQKLNSHLVEGNGNMGQVAMLGQMKSDFLAMRLDLVYMMALKDQAKLKEKWDDFAMKIGSVREVLKKFEATAQGKLELENLAVFKEGFDKYVVNGTKLGEMLLAAHAADNDNAVAAATNFGAEQVGPLYAKPAAAVAVLVDNQLKETQLAYEKDKKEYQRDVLVMGVIICAALVLSFLLGLVISRSISGPLDRVCETMSQVAAGNLTVRSEIDSRDEMGLLAREVNVMADKLRDIMAQVAQTAVEVSSASAQLRSTSDQIATGADEVASQTNTVATASEEMAATSSDIARNCLNAADNSRHASDTAHTGSDVVQETICGMARIAERVKQAALTVEELGARSDQIGAIIGTIEDIADQTNLLALNAAIEAARAGEQGRGFAVVADEVRALAERTTRATREIGEMIKAIQAKTKGAVVAMEEGVAEVEKGTDSSRKSGEALEGILLQINEVTMQVNQIATAAEEQTATTGEITANIQQITDVVHQTARGATETASAAADLSRQAEELQRLVGQFRLA